MDHPTTKKCSKCGEVKPIEEFYRHKRCRDGRIGYCKDCHKAWGARWQKRNPEKAAAASSRYSARHREKINANTRRWTRENRHMKNASNARWNDRRPGASSAHLAVWYAVKTGKLKRQPCEVCGSEDVHAHHDDYSKKLEVRWLCPKHHARLHRDGD